MIVLRAVTETSFVHSSWLHLCTFPIRYHKSECPCAARTENEKAAYVNSPILVDLMDY
jgi:hypothetical protein